MISASETISETAETKGVARPSGERPPLRPGVLLCHVDADASPAPLDLAVDIARRSDAAVFGVGAESFDAAWALGDDLNAGIAFEAWRETSRARLLRARERFHQATAPLEGRAYWCDEDRDPAEAVNAHAGGADLIVAARPAPHEAPLRAPPPADLILGSGCPVLLASEHRPQFSAARVAVAWRATPEVHRAISGALRFLVAAEEVILIEILDETAREAAQNHLPEVRRRLERFGCRVALEQRSESREGVTADLKRVMRERRVDLLVAGAYGHSRLREWVLGGVTRDLLGSCDTPVLFSH